MGSAAEQYDDEVVNIGSIRAVLNAQTIAELEGAYRIAKDHAEAYRDAAKHVAERSGIEPAALKRWIQARVNDKVAQHMRETGQLRMLFEEF